MKKSCIKSLLITILSLLLFVSCQNSTPSATEILFDALDSIDNLPPYEIFYSGAPSYSESVLSDRDAELLYKDPNISRYAESFACALGKDDSIWEIHIFIALSAGDAGFIENALTRRLEILQNQEIYIYDPEAYEKRVEDARVFRDGKIVVLTLCDDNSKVLKTIKKH